MEYHVTLTRKFELHVHVNSCPASHLAWQWRDGDQKVLD